MCPRHAGAERCVRAGRSTCPLQTQYKYYGKGGKSQSFILHWQQPVRTSALTLAQSECDMDASVSNSSDSTSFRVLTSSLTNERTCSSDSYMHATNHELTSRALWTTLEKRSSHWTKLIDPK
jgi:hypothetical protein